jgi:hypothetical protein
MASATIFGWYLWYAGRYLPEQLNDAFSAIGIEDYKNFVRLHVDADKVTAYAVGIRRVPRAWRVSTEKNVSAAFIVPAKGSPLEPELIEPPLTVAGSCPACRAGVCPAGPPRSDRVPIAADQARAREPNTAS